MTTAQTTAPTAMVTTPEVLETAVLLLLREQPRHGYALVAPLNEMGVEVTEMSRLYRILRGLEAEGIVVSTWDTSSHGKGPARKVYALTRRGHTHLRRQMRALRAGVEVAGRLVEMAQQ